MSNHNRPGKRVYELGSLDVKGHQGLSGSFPAAAKVLGPMVVPSSHTSLEPPILVLQWPLRVLLRPVETAKNESDEGDETVVQVPTRRGSEIHP